MRGYSEITNSVCIVIAATKFKVIHFAKEAIAKKLIIDQTSDIEHEIEKQHSLSIDHLSVLHRTKNTKEDILV